MRDMGPLSFLVQEYGFRYQMQAFENACYPGSGTVVTHSYFNENGCFTIRCLPVKGETDYFMSQQFSEDLSALCSQSVDILSIERGIWRKHTHIGPVKKPFFWWSAKRVNKALAEAIRAHIEDCGAFYGLKI